nr:hypothetical protein [uncultured Flavobacterium sp.]
MNTKIQDDISHIKAMMERSSRFISLSGLSGIVAGSIALVGAFVAFLMLKEHGGIYKVTAENKLDLVLNFSVLAVVVLISAIGAGTLFTLNKSKRLGLPIWTQVSKNVLKALLIPLVTGGLFCIALVVKQEYAFVAPAMLIFYGLALLNAEKFLFSDIKYLGYLELALGLISSFVLYYGLLFWTLGFGVLHILYGIILYKKYN